MSFSGQFGVKVNVNALGSGYVPFWNKCVFWGREMCRLGVNLSCRGREMYRFGINVSCLFGVVGSANVPFRSKSVIMMHLGVKVKCKCTEIGICEASWSESKIQMH